jgi:hypothetical protein
VETNNNQPVRCAFVFDTSALKNARQIVAIEDNSITPVFGKTSVCGRGPTDLRSISRALREISKRWQRARREAEEMGKYLRDGWSNE